MHLSVVHEEIEAQLTVSTNAGSDGFSYRVL